MLVHSIVPHGERVKIKSGPHAGKTGTIHSHFVLGHNSDHDVIHRIALDEPIFVDDQKPNPDQWGPSGPTGRKLHEEPMPKLQVDYLEVPFSCLE